MTRKGIRDPSLLDALEELAPTSLNTTLWRVTREGRLPYQCSRGGGRWDDTSFEVLYTSKLEEGAIAEMYFHLRRGQPVVPSKPVYRVHQLTYNAINLLDLTDPSLLSSLGLDLSNFGKLGYSGRMVEYQRSQMIGEAANFLGHDGIIVPNARWDTSNVIVFCEQSRIDQIDDSNDGRVINWKAWRAQVDDGA